MLRPLTILAGPIYVSVFSTLSRFCVRRPFSHRSRLLVLNATGLICVAVSMISLTLICLVISRQRISIFESLWEQCFDSDSHFRSGNTEFHGKSIDRVVASSSSSPCILGFTLMMRQHAKWTGWTWRSWEPQNTSLT